MKKRSESFFGLHFDFHASPENAPGPIGKTLREEDIREICRLIRPDFLQIDCKGHPGWASYPSGCGNAMPEFALDTLELWRRVTREEGVALYMHYSGVWDFKYCRENPSERVMRADGSFSDSATRTNGRYADELLIPQLSELAGKYGVDGVWVDGDCWGSEADFHPETVAAFEKETGIKLEGKLPAKRGDPHFEDYREFCRELFRRYVRHYVDTLHAEHPNFQVASNWAFSDHMPEPVTAKVDFISGDLNPWDSFDSARYAARAIAQQGMTWDLMSWNFRAQNSILPAHAPKNPVQIMQEAAAVISLGGGFQNYITQYPDGAPRMDEIRRMKPVADFMRARQDFCFRGRAVHQAAILLSTYDRHRESGSLFSRNGCEKIMGLTSLFCDAGQSTEIVSEHTISGKCADYPLIVVPELFEGLAEETVSELLAYAFGGGNLMLAGKNTCRLFEKHGAGFTTAAADCPFFTLDGEEFGVVSGPVSVQAENAAPYAWLCSSQRSEDRLPFAALIPFGKGKIAAVGADLGSSYQKCSQYLFRRLVRAAADSLYAPVARIESSLGLAELTVLSKDGRLMIQLVNSNGNHAGTASATEDNLPPVCDILLSLDASTRPAKLILRPEGRELPFEVRGGRFYFTVDRLPIHSIVEVVTE